MNWIPLAGLFDQNGADLLFKGCQIELPESGNPEQGGLAKRPLAGQAICNETLADGHVSVDITFAQTETKPLAEIIFSFDPASRSMLTAGLGLSTAEGMFPIRQWDGKDWTIIGTTGALANLETCRTYRVCLMVKGSFVTLNVDGIEVLAGRLGISTSESQVGVFCISSGEIRFTNFKVEKRVPKVFVVMQFTERYNELFDQVIKPVCKELGLQAHRADETYSPGLIIADIVKQLSESKIVIAEITEANPNVYYEVGYSHAMNKPTILIADKGIKLPFDVSAFRTLFYENSIGGKHKIENGLREFLSNILAQPANLPRTP
jgi:hypothetical protein